jgi:hypothetical protein
MLDKPPGNDADSQVERGPDHRGTVGGDRPFRGGLPDGHAATREHNLRSRPEALSHSPTRTSDGAACRASCQSECS